MYGFHSTAPWHEDFYKKFSAGDIYDNEILNCYPGTKRKTNSNVMIFDNLQRGVVYLASIKAVSNLKMSSAITSKYFQTCKYIFDLSTTE